MHIDKNYLIYNLLTIYKDMYLETKLIYLAFLFQIYERKPFNYDILS